MESFRIRCEDSISVGSVTKIGKSTIYFVATGSKNADQVIALLLAS